MNAYGSLVGCKDCGQAILTTFPTSPRCPTCDQLAQQHNPPSK